MYKYILLIGAGSFIGGVSRFLMSRYIQNSVVSGFPYGTLLVNVLGCFIIGFLTGIADKSAILTVEWRMFLMVGICGGFTTFSSFANENLMLLHNGLMLSILLYTGLSILLGFTAVYLGYVTSNLL